MEVAAVAIQQASLQMNTALAMVKKSAEAEQALINVIAQSATGGRGQFIDISV